MQNFLFPSNLAIIFNMSAPVKAYDPKAVEEKIYKKWLDAGYFAPEANPKAKKPFTIVIPPPNVTGSLHMGHALNATIQDILIRKRRMEGFRTLWLPGIDHAGIATQNVVEKELKKQGISRHELGREKFLEKVWEWKEKYGHIILDQFKKLGCSLDWSRTRFTMDEDYQEAVKQAFIHYYNRGWIYRGERTVNWCSRCGTSLSDLEIEYKEEDAQMYYIKYGPLTIATVRPETKLGDTAVAVNSKDARYKKYIGKEIEIETVLGPAKMKVIGDPSVDTNFGTGAMKVTPAHDMHDFELSEKHGLEKKQVIGLDGRMTALAGKYAGMKVHEARAAVVEDMKKIGILVKIESYKHNVAKCYRCGTVLEPLLSKQWFLKMQELAKKAIKAVKSGKVKFHPKRWGKIYFDWLENVKDWCISRQIWWGHQLPVWFHEPKCVPRKGHEGDIVKCKEFVVAASEPKCEYCDAKFIQSKDVLDTWFSSALWPFATLGWPFDAGHSTEFSRSPQGKPKKGSDLKTFYPTQVLSTDRGIINLWVARMIFSGLEFMDKEPFKDVIIHATILTKDGKRMSKSKGTGLDPLDLISKYGADATRFGIIWQTMGTQDVRWSEEHVIAGRKFCNKIWNAGRFVLLNKPSLINADLERGSTRKIKGVTEDDKKILASLEKTKKEVSKLIDQYEFGQALHIVYEFFWHEFCDVYIEVAKKQIEKSLPTGDLPQGDKAQIANREAEESTKEILFYVLFSSLKLLHPFMPFITEEIYQQLNLKQAQKSVMIEEW